KIYIIKMSVQNKSNIEQLYEKYENQQKAQPFLEQEKQLLMIINTECNPTDENFKIKEKCFYSLAEQYKKQNNAQKIGDLITTQKEQINQFTKAKAAKVIKNLIEYVSLMPNTEDLQIKLFEYLIDWCKREERTYLRHRIEIKLATLHNQNQNYTKALLLIENILKETRKADDKQLLVEAQLIESKIQYSLENLAKSKASLTASRACANSIYCSPALQADIDMMSGILQAEDKDYKTAYSYFYEAFEALNSADDVKAIKALKYMLLCKIMTGNYDDINQLLSGKYGLKYAGDDLQAMKQITLAYQANSLQQFSKLITEYSKQITGDAIIKNQLNQLHDQLLEQNLFRVIEPYTRVQISHISEQIKLNQELIQSKLSELILDKKIDGTLDQGSGCLILFDDIKCDDLYKNALEHNNQMEKVTEKLFQKAKQLKL
ncbi:pci domain protein, partial [Ichthyophthirius multifiliis]